jgi:hypothetical protein
MPLWLLPGALLLVGPAASASVGAYCAACSYNGRCGPGGTCECDAAWEGSPSCAKLALLPSSKHLGYQGLAGGQNVTSWGGSVVFGADGTYHMYAAEITGNWCGLHHSACPLALTGSSTLVGLSDGLWSIAAE